MAGPRGSDIRGLHQRAQGEIQLREALAELRAWGNDCCFQTLLRAWRTREGAGGGRRGIPFSQPVRMDRTPPGLCQPTPLLLLNHHLLPSYYLKTIVHGGEGKVQCRAPPQRADDPSLHPGPG